MLQVRVETPAVHDLRVTALPKESSVTALLKVESTFFLPESTVNPVPRAA